MSFLDLPEAPATEAPSMTGPGLPGLELATDNTGLPAETSNVFSRAVCLVLKMKGFSNSRTLLPTEYSTAANDPEMTRASKKRLVSDQLKAISDCDAAMRKWLYARSLPSPLGGGTYMIPITQLRSVRDKLAQWAGSNGLGGERGEKIAAFVASYPDAYDEARDLLGGLFNPADYPVCGDLMREQHARGETEADNALWEIFSASWKYVSFQTSEQLRQVDPQLFLDEANKAAAEWNEFRGQVTTMLRDEMAKLVDDMVEKVSGKTESGRKKTVRGTFLPHLNEWLELVNDRNLTNDTRLRELTDRMKNLVQGVNEDDLKKNEDTRTKLAQGFAQIRSEINTMMVDQPVRRFDFDEL